MRTKPGRPAVRTAERRKAVAGRAETRGQKRSRSPDIKEELFGIPSEDDSSETKGVFPWKRKGSSNEYWSSAQTPTKDHLTKHGDGEFPPGLPKTLSTSPKPDYSKTRPLDLGTKAFSSIGTHTTDQLTNDGDEYIPRQYDEQGEQKISPTGELLGDRRFKIRVFTLTNRGVTRFMLASECSRVLGYRDSYLLFYQNLSLHKIIAAQGEKDDLINQEILPQSYRSRQIAIVTAKSVFRQFGAKVIEGGRRVQDDYWEAQAVKLGLTREDRVGDDRSESPKASNTARWPGIFSYYHADPAKSLISRVKYEKEEMNQTKIGPYSNATPKPVDKAKEHNTADHHQEKMGRVSEHRRPDKYDKGGIDQDRQENILDLFYSSRTKSNKDAPSYKNRGDMHSIWSHVINVFPVSSRAMNAASLYMKWDLPQFMRSQFSDNDKATIASVITLSGSALCAQATTCSQYVRSTWPTYGETVLNVFQQALKAANNKAKDIVPEFEIFVDLNNDCRLDVRSESSECIAQVFQQVIWMGAALRVSKHENVQYSGVVLDSPGGRPGLLPRQFKVSFETSELSETEQSCWIPLFANPVIVQGFPISERQNEEQGLEIQLEMMAALGGARYMTTFDGGLVMKGHSTLFVPVKLNADSVQWHCIYEKDGNRLAYRELRNRCPNRALLDTINHESIKDTRAFLGWWHSGTTHLGTAGSDYANIDWSPATETRRSARFSGTDIGFQTMVTGKLSFMMGPKDGRLHVSRSGPFRKVIQCAEKTPIVLYDLEDRRAWLVPALGVILHIFLTRHRLDPYHVEGESVKFAFASPSRQEGRTVMDTVLKNQSLKIYESDASSEKDFYFSDAILDIWSQMERLMEKDNDIEAGPGLPLRGTMRSKLHGWEYMSLVHEKNYRQKEAVIEKSNGGWVDLVDNIDSLVLFATGLKEVIQPLYTSGHLCHRWQTLPKEKDYLAAGVPLLEMLYSEAGSRISRKYLTTNQLQWHRGPNLFERCSRNRCKCDRTQQIYHESWFKTFGHVSPPGKLEENGCVVFGQAQHAFRPARSVHSGENPIHMLPNVPLDVPRALSPTPQPTEEHTPTTSPTRSVIKDFQHAEIHRPNSPKRPISPLNRSDDTLPGAAVMPKRRRRLSVLQGEEDSNSPQVRADRNMAHPIRLRAAYAYDQQENYTAVIAQPTREPTPNRSLTSNNPVRYRRASRDGGRQYTPAVTGIHNVL